MEYILIDDLRSHIEILQKYVRPVGVKEHPLLVDEGIRAVDFLLSEDRTRVLPSNEHGLSFATSMKKFKKVYQLKARFFSEIEVYALDDATPLPPHMKMIRDRPGHACLTITREMTIQELTDNLKRLARTIEYIGRIKVSPA